MQFDIETPDGRIFTLEGDSEPTEQDLMEFYNSFSQKEQEAANSIEINPNNLKYDDIVSNRIVASQKMSDYMKGMLNFSIGKTNTENKPKEKSYFDKLTTFEVKKTEQEPEGVQIAKDVYNAFKDMPSKVSVSEITKSTARSMLDLSKSTFEGIMGIADWMRNTDVLPKNDFRAGTGKLIYKTAELFKKLSDKGLNSQLLKQPEDIYAGSFAENPSYMRLLDTVMSGSSSFAAMYGIGGALKCPKLAAGLMAVGDSSEVYWDAINSGTSVDKAMGLYSVSMGLSAGLEKYGIDRVIGENAKSISNAILSEGATEMLQQGIAINLVKKIGYDDTVDLFEGVLESAIIGGIWGGVGRSVTIAEEKLQNVRKLLSEKGYNEDETTAIIDGVGEVLKENGETIDKQINPIIEKNISMIERKLQEMPKEEQDRFRTETAKVREEYVNAVEKSFPEWTPEQVKATSDYLTAQTVGLSLIENISPLEAKERMAKMERTTEEEFFKALENPGDVATENADTYYQIAQQNEELDKVNPAYEGETININGAEKTVYNSTGERIAKSEPALRNFYKWFGDSKVVDEQGRPLVVYHGTNADFDTFDMTKAKSGIGGIYFTSNPNYYYLQESKNKIIAYLRLENSITDETINNKKITKKTIEKIYKHIEPYIEYKEEKKEVKEYFNDIDVSDSRNIRDILGDVISGSMYSLDENVIKVYEAIIQETGIDGIQNKAGEETHYIVFSPNQLKSVDNRGTFSKDSDNIYYQMAGEQAQTAALEQLDVAKRMEENRYSEEEIRQETGWFKGKDDKWRFEISDKDAKIDEKTLKMLDDENHDFELRLGDILEHDKLYAAYPELADVIVVATRQEGIGGKLSKGRIQINPKTKLDLKSVLLHEIQHWIQSKEGFAKGGNLQMFYDQENIETISQYLEDEDSKKYQKLLMSELYGNYDEKSVDAIYKAEDKFKEISKAVREHTGEDWEELDKEADKALDMLTSALEGAGLTMDEYTEIKEKVREKAGVDAFGRSKRAKKYSPVDLYKALYGEIEARNTQARADMTEEERKATPIEETQDIKNAEAIVLFDDGTMAAYEPNKGFNQTGERAEPVKMDDKWRFEPKFYSQGEYHTKPKGAYINGKIYLFEGADVSTVQHEYAHAFDDYLTKLNSPESIAMKDSIDNWTKQEFSRKYEVIGEEGKHFVIDNTRGGRIVYDNMGKKFKTIKEAEDYTRKEIFAQGAEKYASTQEAPSNVLKRAFRAFIEFFKESYHRTKALNIELTPEIKEVYSNMLGGVSLDTFLNESIDDFMKKRQEVQQQIKETIADDIQKVEEKAQPVQLQNGTGIDEYLEVEKSSIKERRVQASSIVKATVLLSNRASKISKAFHARLNRYEFNKRQASKKRKELIKGFLEKAFDMKKNNPENYAKLKYAMLNDNFDLLKELSDEYEMAGDFAKVQDVMDEIYNSATELGFEINYKGNYLPRAVKDYNKFIKKTSGGIYSPMEKMIKDAEKELKRNLTQQERAELINMRLRTQANNDVLKGVNHAKGRTVEYIDAEMAELYEHPVETMVKYVEKMSERIETAKFLGKNKNTEGSIGDYVNQLVEDGVIDSSNIDEALNIIRAMLEDNPVNSKLLRNLRDAGYVATMGNFGSAITQLDDFSSAWHNAGLKKALKAAFLKSGRNADINTYDLAIDQIGNEFKTAEGLSKTVETLFKTTGLTKIDTFMKNTFINSDLDRMKNMPDAALKEELRPLFETEEEVNQVIKDIKAGNNTTDTLFVSWHNLSKYQPISRLESPEWNKGDAKFFYALKSFTLKRIDLHLQNINKLKYSKTAKERNKAILEELRLGAILMICGMEKDALIDLIYGRRIDLSDTFVNNFWGLIGINKYFVYKAREEGAGSMITSTLFSVPILNVYNTFQKDIGMYLSKNSKGEKKREFKDLDTFKYLPYLGGFYYWRIGGGKVKQEKKERAEKTKNKKTARR